MSLINWSIDLKDDSGNSYFFDEDCSIDFSHGLNDDDNVEITVDGFTNCHGAYFSSIADNATMKYIYLAAADWLENNDDFLEKAYETVAHEYYVTGLGSNNPDAITVRRV